MFAPHHPHQKYCSIPCQRKGTWQRNKPTARLLECEWCGAEFQARTSQQKYCSVPCQQASYKNKLKVGRDSRPNICPECGESFEPNQRGAPKKYCSRVCTVRSGNRRNNRSRLPLMQPRERSCDYCGESYVARSRDSRYCPDSWCRQLAYQKRKREGKSRLVVPHKVTCDDCGNEFVGKHPSARWCSKKCANRHWGRVRSRQRRRPTRAKYTDLQVFERDNWTCHICGGPVDPDLDRLHEMGATIDHITPISKGGVDELDNVALAHWSCNREKGATLS